MWTHNPCFEYVVYSQWSHLKCSMLQSSGVALEGICDKKIHKISLMIIQSEGEKNKYNYLYLICKCIFVLFSYYDGKACAICYIFPIMTFWSIPFITAEVPWGNCYDWQMREGLAETTCCLGSHFTGILVGLLGSHFTDTLSGLLGSHFTDILVGLVGDTDTGTALPATGRITMSPLGTWSWSSLWSKYLVAQIPG